MLRPRVPLSQLHPIFLNPILLDAPANALFRQEISPHSVECHVLQNDVAFWLTGLKPMNKQKCLVYFVKVTLLVGRGRGTRDLIAKVLVSLDVKYLPTISISALNL